MTPLETIALSIICLTAVSQSLALFSSPLRSNLTSRAFTA